jgi:hypothetical protein
MIKTLNQIIFFFLHQNQNLCSTLSILLFTCSSNFFMNSISTPPSPSKVISNPPSPSKVISNPPSPSKVISQATKEVQSRVERRNNTLVFNVPESESNMKNQVVIDDTNIFLELCNIVEAGIMFYAHHTKRVICLPKFMCIFHYFMFPILISKCD